MIYNSTYNDIEKEIEKNNLVGKKFNLIKSIRLGGIGSKRLIVEDLSVNFKKMIQNEALQNPRVIVVQKLYSHHLNKDSQILISR